MREKLEQESDRSATGGNKEKRKKKERGRAVQEQKKWEKKKKNDHKVWCCKGDGTWHNAWLPKATFGTSTLF
jgi:hypothetical protein